MHDLPLILTLTVGLAVALVLGYVTHRVGLSSIVGYLLAGIVIGRVPTGVVADAGIASQLSELGVILLMFGVGLHFQLKELLAVRRVALPGAVGQSLVATVIGAFVVMSFGWDLPAGVIFGLALSVASTVVLLRILSDAGTLHTRAGHIAIGWLVVEDLFTVVVLVILPAVFGSLDASHAESSHGLALTLVIAGVKIAVLVAVTFVAGGKFIPWLMTKIVETRSRELFTLTVLVLALGLAVGSATLFGVSMALGAFLGGMVVGRSDFSLRAASDALPMKDAFAVIFFVSIGMLFDPHYLIESPGLVAATLGVVLICKPLIAMAIVCFLGYPVKVALSVSVALAQIGEFSFILASLGNQLGILPVAGTNALIAASIVSITLNPILYRWVGPMEKWLEKRPKLWAFLNARAPKAGDEHAEHAPAATRDPAHRAVIVGYGPIGRNVARLLRENDVEPTIIEMNLDTVAKLKAEGVRVVYGDATHHDTLKAAGVAESGALILSASGMHAAEEVIRTAREINPSVRILARADFAKEIGALKKVGADRVYASESEIALAFTVSILRRLGATPDQIDRERDRIRADLAAD